MEELLKEFDVAELEAMANFIADVLDGMSSTPAMERRVREDALRLLLAGAFAEE